MPRPSNQPLIACEFFAWRLFSRSGVWYADGRSNNPILGKQSLNTTDREKALVRLRQLDRVMAQQRGLCKEVHIAGSSNKIAIDAGWEIHTRHVTRPEILGGTGRSTQKRYRAVRDKHIEFCRTQRIESWVDVDQRHVAEYMTYLEKTGYKKGKQRKRYAKRSLYLEASTVVSAHKLLVEQKHLLPDRRFTVPLRKPQGSDTYCFTVEQVSAMLKLCEKDTDLPWLRDVILFAACTGMRISEIASVRWTDIQYDRQHEPAFVVLTDERSSSRCEEQRRIKGRRGRHVPIHPRVRELLGGLHHSQDGRLFHGPKGGRLKPDTVRNVFVREVIAVLKSRFSTPTGEIGFEHARLHSFRHFFVSQAFMQGAREGEIKDWVGHKDSRVVELYRHLSKDLHFRRTSIAGMWRLEF